MPAELTPKERIAKLETWREEHTREQDREHNRQQGFSNRRVIIIAASIGFAGAILGGLLSAWLVSLWLVSLLSN